MKLAVWNLEWLNDMVTTDDQGQPVLKPGDARVRGPKPPWQTENPTVAERSALIDRAARIKAERGLPARIDWRVEEVVANARRNAADAGLDGALFAQIWRQLVDAAIDQEERHLNGDRP